MKYVIHFNNEFGNFDKRRSYNIAYLKMIERYFCAAFGPKYYCESIPLNEILLQLGGRPIDIGWKYGFKSLENIVFSFNQKGTNPNVNVTLYLEEV